VAKTNEQIQYDVDKAGRKIRTMTRREFWNRVSKMVMAFLLFVLIIVVVVFKLT